MFRKKEGPEMAVQASNRTFPGGILPYKSGKSEKTQTQGPRGRFHEVAKAENRWRDASGNMHQDPQNGQVIHAATLEA